jgi:mRNA interferase MazF
MRQYEIRWANLPLPIGKRPVLLLSRTSAYAYLNKVIVVEVTSTIRGIPQEVALGKKEGLQHSSVANMDNLHVIPKSLREERIGVVGAVFAA